jgi:hypothetical protein
MARHAAHSCFLLPGSLMDGFFTSGGSMMTGFSDGRGLLGGIILPDCALNGLCGFAAPLSACRRVRFGIALSEKGLRQRQRLAASRVPLGSASADGRRSKVWPLRRLGQTFARVRAIRFLAAMRTILAGGEERRGGIFDLGDVGGRKLHHPAIARLAATSSAAL